eukprot:8834083-Pyramimonas_sp.AAC.1
MACHLVTPTGEVDLHRDSTYRRFTDVADDEVQGHGIRRTNLLLRGRAPNGNAVVHVTGARCQLRRLQ